MPPSTSRILDGLNPEQRRAVETTDGPLLVLAGAGTGKTKVITCRIARLVEKGSSPDSILAMTFTNKAAGEMRERVAKVTSPDAAKRVTVGTFHAFCVRLLREHGEAIGWPRTFALCDESDQLAALKGVLRELRVGEAKIKPSALKGRISLLKNRMVTSKEYADGHGDEKDDLVARAWIRYDEQLRRSRSMDFDDLLLEALRLLRERPEIRDRLRARFTRLLVDEYQDTNAPQFEIVRGIGGGHRNVCVVGDDDQSIYAFRGADVRKILEFEKHFPGAAVIRLETNYRSTAQILAAANAVIRNNPARHEKTLRSHAGDGAPVEVVELDDEEAEAEHVAREIHAGVLRGRVRWSDFAVLIRTAVQARPLETRFRAKGVPYVLVGGMSFFDRKEVRDVLAFVRLAANRDDEVSLLRVINTPPRGVGDTTVDRVVEWATGHGISAGAAFDRGDEVPDVSTTAVAAVREFRAKLDALGAEWHTRRGAPPDVASEEPEPSASQGSSPTRSAANSGGTPMVDWLRRLLRAVDYAAEIQRCYPEQRDQETRWAAVMEVLNVAENYCRRTADPTLTGFLEEVTLVGDDAREEKEKARDRVTLMTLHAAKGLEFPIVYLVGLEEGLFPHQRSVQEDMVEEERRLMYVGVTRAKKVLTVTRAKARAKYGRRAETMPSRFLFEMQGTAPPPGWQAARAKDDDPAPAERPSSATQTRTQTGTAARPPRGAPRRRAAGRPGAVRAGARRGR